MSNQTERRAEARHRTLKGGLIAFNGGRSTIDCKVRNLSPIGARLDVAAVMGIPDTFELAFGGQIVACRVIWRKLQELGVEFVR
jgi:hypothetical protein